VFIGFFAPADMRIIIGRFEWWFKQCDESNLNRGAAVLDFRQRAIKERAAHWRVGDVPQLRFPAVLLNKFAICAASFMVRRG
jgi:hypothetical protein